MAEYVSDEVNEEFKLNMTITHLPPQPPKKMDMGKIPVCEKCGCTFWGWKKPESEGGGERECTCGGKVTSLRKYITEVLKQPFDESKWTMVDGPDIVVGLDDYLDAKVEVPGEKTINSCIIA